MLAIEKHCHGYTESYPCIRGKLFVLVSMVISPENKLCIIKIIGRNEEAFIVYRVNVKVPFKKVFLPSNVPLIIYTNTPVAKGTPLYFPSQPLEMSAV
jgi:hypothetical protein